MGTKLVVNVVMIAFDRRTRDCTIRSRDLPSGSRLVHLGQPMIDVMTIEDAIVDLLTLADIPLA